LKDLARERARSIENVGRDTSASFMRGEHNRPAMTFNAIVNMSWDSKREAESGRWTRPLVNLGLLYWLVNDEPRRRGSQQPFWPHVYRYAFTRICLRLSNYVLVSWDARKNGHVA